MKDVKPFTPHPYKTVTVTIEEDGSMTFLKTDSADIFLELGEVVTRRASHVEPLSIPLRLAFKVCRVFGDNTRLAAWTRGWSCLWRVNTAPVGGPVLPDLYHDRSEAIAAEITFLNQYFAERKFA